MLLDLSAQAHLAILIHRTTLHPQLRHQGHNFSVNQTAAIDGFG